MITNIILTQGCSSDNPNIPSNANLPDSLTAKGFISTYKLTQEEIDLIKQGYHFLTNTGYASGFLTDDPRLKKIRTLEKYETMYCSVLKEEFESRGFQDVLILPHSRPDNYTCIFGVFYKSRIEK